MPAPSALPLDRALPLDDLDAGRQAGPGPTARPRASAERPPQPMSAEEVALVGLPSSGIDLLV